ncbi:hypothetical protein Droror1_Dr00027834 [Drosera rotundifolia]
MNNSNSSGSSRCKYYKQNTSQQNQRSNFILPIFLCSRPSTSADAALVRQWHRRSSSLVDVDDAAVSPKLGCTGQVKRTNKVNSFPSSVTARNSVDESSSSSNRNDDQRQRYFVKYHKLKRFFSSKSLTPKTPNTILPAAARSSVAIAVGSRSEDEDRISDDRCRGVVEEKRRDVSLMIDVAELDPPLPVMRKDRLRSGCGDGNGAESLWKRRSGGGGVGLQTLQVKSVHSHFLQPNTL